MHCGICQKELRDCDCPDTDERLRRVAHDLDSVCSSHWCLACDRHAERCNCEKPNQNHVIMVKGEPQLQGEAKPSVESPVEDKERAA